jgi:asparagine synthase (glutamine-hydrolysing)
MATFASNAREARYRILLPGRSLLGALWAEKAAAVGLDVRDPTGDIRVLKFCLSIPDAMYFGPTPADDRWLIRSAMVDLLPNNVRLNRSRGRQSADVVIRLRHEADEVEGLLTLLVAGPASDYLDFNRLSDLWRRIRNEDSPAVFRATTTILLRSMMAGLYLDQQVHARHLSP